MNLHLSDLQNEFRKEYLAQVNAINEMGGTFNAKTLRRTAKEKVVRKYLSLANETLGSAYEISGRDIERHLAQKFLLPMKVGGNISQAEYEKLMWILPKDSPLQPAADEVRHYPCGELACHVIGYAPMDDGQRDAQGLAENVKTFAAKRQVGKAGIELAKDDVLHGASGYELWQVDTLGRNRELVEAEKPKRGNSVTLSIDRDLQSVAEEAFGAGRGCAIAMDIKTGEILAMVSKPSYDINSLVPHISHDVYNEITEKSGWVNIGTQGKFPLGSPFEIVSALAFLKSGEVLQTDSVLCGSETEVGETKIHHKNHDLGETITFQEAIVRDCDTFFHENAKKIKVDRIIGEAIALGLAEKTGIELPYEGKGFVPTEAWKGSQGFGDWVPGDTMNLAVGRGYLLVTPLEVCCLTASVAANRLRTKPTIFLNGNDGPLPNEPGLGLGEDDYKFLVDSMVAAVDGDGELGLCAPLEGVKVAGKMGTVQSFEGGEKRKLAWFTCFAPADDPRIAVTVTVQEKSKGDSHWRERNAMAVAGEILGEYFSKNELLKTAAPIDSAPSVDGNEIGKGDSQWQGGGSD